MLVVEKLDKIMTCQAAMQQQQAVMANDLKHVISDNVEFKSSTNKNISTLKTDYYETKKTVEKISFLGKILAAIYAGVIGLLSIFYVK